MVSNTYLSWAVASMAVGVEVVVGRVEEAEAACPALPNETGGWCQGRSSSSTRVPAESDGSISNEPIVAAAALRVAAAVGREAVVVMVPQTF